MSAEEAHPSQRGRLPSFDLAYRYDDPEDPTEVTVFEPGSGNVTAEWISADPRHTIPLEHVA